MALAVASATAAHGQQQQVAPVPAAPFRQLIVHGAGFFTDEDVAQFLKLRIDEPLPAAPPALASELQQRYADRGYLFARVEARFDEPTGRLELDVDEGRIDAVEFSGVPASIADAFVREFALQPGDVFRRTEASRALTVLLRTTQGAVRPAGQQALFEMLDREGKHVLVVHLRTRRSDFNLTSGTAGRQDWFNPVDGFSPSIGFNETVFDPVGFNHTYISGYVSYKFARERAGYAIGFERPFFPGPHLFLGAEWHDDSASDDTWRLSSLEQSLAGAALRRSYRDYYERRGYQLNASLRFGGGHEVLAAWRDERQVALFNTSDFSVFRSDQSFRPNLVAQGGRLHALVFGYAWDSRGLEAESRSGRYERHQLTNLFGSRGGEEPGWRIEWTSEIAAPRLGGDFDYRRHILNVRRYTRLSPHHGLDLRAIGGVGDGTLPPQRFFGLGGIGSVPGYGFKESVGERMLLFDAEYGYRLSRSFRPIVLYDAGRVFRPITSAALFPGGSASLPDRWMQAVGGGFELGDSFRIEAHWPLEHGRSATILIRLGPTF